MCIAAGPCRVGRVVRPLGARDMATEVREVERKFEAAAGTAVLDVVTTMTGTAGVAAVSPRDQQLLDAVYYDTADLRLIRAGITPAAGAPAARMRAGT